MKLHTVTALGTFAFLATSVDAAPKTGADIMISEYVEGSSNTKAVELFNPTAQAISLKGVSLQWHQNGKNKNSDGRYRIDDEFNKKTLKAGKTFVICRSGKSDLQANKCDLTISSKSAAKMAVMHNGDDSIELKFGGSVIDRIGKSNKDPGSCWKDAKGKCMTKDKTIRRKSSITSGSSTWVISQWNIYNKNTVNGLGAHTVKTTTTAKPCVMVDCMQGWKLVGADRRGCGGTCKKQCPVVRCAAPGPFCKYMKDNKKDANGCLQFPCGIRKCDACVMVKCKQGFDLVGTKTIGDTSGCGGTCKKQCPVVKCAAPLKGCTRQMFPNKKDADGCLKHPCGIDTCADTLTWKDLKDETKICKDVKKCDGRNNGFDSWCPKSTAIKRCAADTACKGIYDISKNQNRWKICTTNKTELAGERGHGVMLLTRTPWEAPKICCRAMTASCLSCSAGLTVTKYCEKNSSTVGCPNKCSHTTCTFKELPHKIDEQAVTVMQVTHSNKESKCASYETVSKGKYIAHASQMHCAKVNDKTHADYGKCKCHKLGFHPNGAPVNNPAGSFAGSAVVHGDGTKAGQGRITEAEYNTALSSHQQNDYAVDASTRDGTDYAAHDGRVHS